MGGTAHFWVAPELYKAAGAVPMYRGPPRRRDGKEPVPAHWAMCLKVFRSGRKGWALLAALDKPMRPRPKAGFFLLARFASLGMHPPPKPLLPAQERRLHKPWFLLVNSRKYRYYWPAMGPR